MMVVTTLQLNVHINLCIWEKNNYKILNVADWLPPPPPINTSAFPVERAFISLLVLLYYKESLQTPVSNSKQSILKK